MKNDDSSFLSALHITPCEFPKPAVAQRVEDVTPADAWITRDEDGEPAVLMSEGTYQALIALAQARHAESVRLALLLVESGVREVRARKIAYTFMAWALLMAGMVAYFAVKAGR